MNAFLTGSQIYGTPTEKSDIDLVIRCDEDTRKLLVKKLSSETDQEDYSCHQLKVGKLNLIFCTTDDQYTVWKKGTEFLKTIKPVLREHAVSVFKALFNVIKAKKEKSTICLDEFLG